MVLGVAVAAKAGAAGGVGLGFGRQQLPALVPRHRFVGLIELKVGRGGVEEEQVDLEAEQAGDLVEDLALELALDLEQPVHGAVAGVVGGQRQAGDAGVLADPARCGQLRGGREGAARDQGEEHALGGGVAALPLEKAAQGGVDPEPPPEAVEGVAAAQRPRAQELEALAGGAEEAALGVLGRSGEEAGERAREALERRPTRLVLAAEVVEHLGARALLHRVPGVVRELQVADDRAVLVLARCRAHVHGLDHYIQPPAKSSTQTLNVYLSLFAILTRSKRSEQGLSVQMWTRGAISCGTPAGERTRRRALPSRQRPTRRGIEARNEVDRLAHRVTASPPLINPRGTTLPRPGDTPAQLGECFS